MFKDDRNEIKTFRGQCWVQYSKVLFLKINTVYRTDSGIQSLSELLTDNFLKTVWTTLAKLAVIFQNCTNKWDYFPLQPAHFPLLLKGTKVLQPLTGIMTLMGTFSFEEHSAESWQPAAVSNEGHVRTPRRNAKNNQAKKPNTTYRHERINPDISASRATGLQPVFSNVTCQMLLTWY